MKVLFVCSGNICRSPMAAACLRHRATEGGMDDLEVLSAGTLGIRGAPASPEAVRALEEIGVDLAGHRSQGILDVDLDHMDVIIGMEMAHLPDARSLSSGHAERCFLIRAFEDGPEPAPDPLELDDPIGMPLEFYREQLRLIARCIDHLARYLAAADGPRAGR